MNEKYRKKFLVRKMEKECGRHLNSYEGYISDIIAYIGFDKRNVRINYLEDADRWWWWSIYTERKRKGLYEVDEYKFYKDKAPSDYRSFDLCQKYEDCSFEKYDDGKKLDIFSPICSSFGGFQSLNVMKDMFYTIEKHYIK